MAENVDSQRKSNWSILILSLAQFFLLLPLSHSFFNCFSGPNYSQDEQSRTQGKFTVNFKGASIVGWLFNFSCINYISIEV